MVFIFHTYFIDQWFLKLIFSNWILFTNLGPMDYFMWFLCLPFSFIFNLFKKNNFHEENFWVLTLNLARCEFWAKPTKSHRHFSVQNFNFSVQNFSNFQFFLKTFQKKNFRFVVPAVALGGWACFITSLIWIGIVTMVIGDLASLVEEKSCFFCKNHVFSVKIMFFL